MKLVYFIISFSFLSNSLLCQTNPNDFIGDLINDYIFTKYSDSNASNFIYIGIKRQKLYLFKDKKLIEIYDISSSYKGAGNEVGSFKTPTGKHRIHEKIGQDAPIGTLFLNKKNTHQIVAIDSLNYNFEKDEITTRVLSLMGMELNLNKGKNIDTFKRGIYIHGTSKEKSIGLPSSHGCIRMRNTDIVDLFNNVDEGTLVFLFDN